MQINEIERYEIAAHAFRRMTGFMAPGKEPPMDSFEEPIERREEAWRYWNHTHGRIVTKILDGVCAVIPDHDEELEILRIHVAELEKLCQEAHEVIRDHAPGFNVLLDRLELETI